VHILQKTKESLANLEEKRTKRKVTLMNYENKNKNSLL